MTKIHLLSSSRTWGVDNDYNLKISPILRCISHKMTDYPFGFFNLQQFMCAGIPI
jgi:hypothetical protein